MKMTEIIVKVNDYFLREVNIQSMKSRYELIRCKDCRHAIRWTDIDGTRGLQCNVTFDSFGYGADVEPYHYCGYAERREDE